VAPPLAPFIMATALYVMEVKVRRQHLVLDPAASAVVAQPEATVPVATAASSMFAPL